MDVGRQLDAVNGLDQASKALNAFLCLLGQTDPERDRLSELHATDLYYLLEPIRVELQRVKDLLYPIRSD